MKFTSFADIKKVLPEGWDLVENRSIYSERKEPNGDGDNELLSVTQDRGIIKQSDYEVKKDSSNEDKSKYKVIYENDIVYNKMRMWQGAVGLSPYEGIVSPAYVVLVPRRDIVPEYFYLQMKTKEYISQSYALSYGLCDDMNSLRYEDFRNMFSVLPPKTAQVKIVNFLRTKLSLIDVFIKNKQDYILKLEESKLTAIKGAITKGIDSDEPMLETGIEWIGAIPKSWQLKRLKFLCSIHNGSDHKDIEEAEGYPVIGSGGQFSYASKYIYDKESVLLGRKGTLDKPIYMDTPFWTVDTMFYTKIKADVFPKFLYYAVLNIPFEYYSTKTALPSMTQTSLGNFRVPTPSYEIQKKIVTYIEKELQIFDQAINKAKHQIELIKEYRDSLITHAVTGQIEIKE